MEEVSEAGLGNGEVDVGIGSPPMSWGEYSPCNFACFTSIDTRKRTIGNLPRPSGLMPGKWERQASGRFGAMSGSGLHKRGIDAIDTRQFLVRAHFDDSTSLQNDDLICASDGG